MLTDRGGGEIRLHVDGSVYYLRISDTKFWWIEMVMGVTADMRFVVMVGRDSHRVNLVLHAAPVNCPHPP